MSEPTALLILDAQVNMFAPGASVADGEALLARLKALVDRARQARAAVLFVRHDGGPGAVDEHGTPGWQIHPGLEVRPGDAVLDKRTPDAFAETPLRGELEARGVQALAIAGMQSEFCIDATVRAAWALGFEVTLASDAHGTYDGSKAASAIIAHVNADLVHVAHVIPADRVAFARCETPAPGRTPAR